MIGHGEIASAEVLYLRVQPSYPPSREPLLPSPRHHHAVAASSGSQDSVVGAAVAQPSGASDLASSFVLVPPPPPKYEVLCNHFLRSGFVAVADYDMHAVHRTVESY